mmetsp:Transcript_29150/g.36587  ORF Transcript_29150/g.36587 Transcript_29150/m.36587 type:complete len:734 (+) Transcript_29150:3-2204(+)
MTADSTILMTDTDLYLIQEEKCSEAYIGNVCQRCAPGYGAAGSGTCSKCGDLTVSYVVFFVGIFAVVIIGVVLILLQMDKENAENEKLSIMFKIFTSYMQLVAIFGHFDLNWPAIILSLFQQQEAISHAGDKIIQIDCVLNDLQGGNGEATPIFYKKLLFYCSMPICAVVFSFIFWKVAYFWKKFQITQKPWNMERFIEVGLGEEVEDGWIDDNEVEQTLTLLGEKASRMRVADVKRLCGIGDASSTDGSGTGGRVRVEDFQGAYLQAYKNIMNGNTVLSVVVLLFMLYTNVSTYVFYVFTCTPLDNTREFLEQDLETQCYTTHHFVWMMLLGLPGMIVYIFGIPAMGYYVLHRNRFDLDEDHVKLKYGFLYDGYEREYFYWEMWVMMRKIFIVFCTVFISRVGPMVEALAGAILVIFATILHMVCNPYEDDSLDRLEQFSLYATLATIMTGLFFYSGEISSTGDYVLIGIIFFVNGLFVVYFLVVTYEDFKDKIIADYISARTQARRYNERLRNKKTQEDLELEKQLEEKYSTLRKQVDEIYALKEEISLSRAKTLQMKLELKNEALLKEELQKRLKNAQQDHYGYLKENEDLQDKWKAHFTKLVQEEEEPETKVEIPVQSSSIDEETGAHAIFSLYRATQRHAQVKKLVNSRKTARLSSLIPTMKERQIEKEQAQIKRANVLLDLHEIHQKKQEHAAAAGVPLVYQRRSPRDPSRDLLPICSPPAIFEDTI